MKIFPHFNGFFVLHIKRSKPPFNEMKLETKTTEWFTPRCPCPLHCQLPKIQRTTPKLKRRHTLNTLYHGPNRKSRNQGTQNQYLFSCQSVKLQTGFKGPKFPTSSPAFSFNPDSAWDYQEDCYLLDCWQKLEQRSQISPASLRVA